MIGCGRIDFERGAPLDSIDVLWTVTCPWDPGFSMAVTRLDVLNDPTAYDLSPTLSPDALSLYFASYRNGTADLFVTTRDSLDAAFGPPTLLSAINTPTANEYGLSVAWDQKGAILTADDAGGSDFYLGPGADAARTEFALLASLSTSSVEWDPYFTVDGEWLYFVSHRDNPFDDIYRSRRFPDGSFGTPEAVSSVNLPDEYDGNPSLLADGSVIVFNTGATNDLHFARRIDATAFGARESVPVVNTAAAEGEPFVRPDGCELFFVRSQDLYQATYLPPP